MPGAPSGPTLRLTCTAWRDPVTPHDEGSRATACPWPPASASSPTGSGDYCRAVEDVPGGKRIAFGFGYFVPRSHSAKMIYRITSSGIDSQLPSGPTLPPVSQAGPAKVGLNRWPLAASPLSGTP